MKSLLKVTYFIIVIVLVPVLLYAPPTGSWNPGDTDPTVPLGGGLIFLSVAALFYGFRTYLKKRK